MSYAGFPVWIALSAKLPRHLAESGIDRPQFFIFPWACQVTTLWRYIIKWTIQIIFNDEVLTYCNICFREVFLTFPIDGRRCFCAWPQTRGLAITWQLPRDYCVCSGWRPGPHISRTEGVEGGPLSQEQVSWLPVSEFYSWSFFLM